MFDFRVHLVQAASEADVSFVVHEPSTCRVRGHLMHRDFLDAAASVGSLGGPPLRTNVNVIGEVPQSWTMRKQLMREVSAQYHFNLQHNAQFCSLESNQRYRRLLSSHCRQVARRAEWGSLVGFQIEKMKNVY